MTGAVPLALFLLDLADNARRGVIWDSLWMCHLANLLMGVGYLSRRPYLVRVGVLWILAGLPLWVRELFLDPSIGFFSYLSHLGGAAWAVLWLYRTRHQPKQAPAWLGAWAIFIAVRVLCYFVTPPNLNVNASHLMRDGTEGVLNSFHQYWLLSTLACGICLYALDRALKGGQGHTHAHQ